MDVEAISALTLMAVCLVMLTRLIIKAIQVYEQEEGIYETGNAEDIFGESQDAEDDGSD